MSKTPTTLIIMDGFGVWDERAGNAIAAARTPNLDKIFAENPGCCLSASGLDVGLPEGQMGNSEVGHTNIGAGRVVFQDLPRISRAIEDGSFFENAAYIGNEVLRPGLEALAEKHAIIGEVRGRGLFQALELVSSREQKTPLTAADMAAIKGALTEAGLLAFVVENRIHVVPPCTITAEQVAQGLAIFDAVFARFASLAK